MARDYKVPFLREETIARRAQWLRNQARFKGKYIIDIIDLIERVLTSYYRSKGGLRISFYDAESYDDRAYVTYRPLTLHVDNKVWRDAKIGLAYAYFILAHEIAHSLFHDHTAVAFSNDATIRLKPFLDEESAEWQAHTFAMHLTIPDDALQESPSPGVIPIVCNVEDDVALERLRLYQRRGPMVETRYQGDVCGNCGNFTIIRAGTDLKCQTCKAIVGCC